MKKVQEIFIIRKIIITSWATFFLVWAFFQNAFRAKIIIMPFLVCSISFFGQNIALLLNKGKIANVFQNVFRISFFVYVFFFLSYMVYYAIANKNYSILILVLIFLPFIIHFFKKSFWNKK